MQPEQRVDRWRLALDAQPVEIGVDILVGDHRCSFLACEARTSPQYRAAMSDAVTPFTLSIPQEALDDLARRLDAVRWPERETVSDWSQGAPLAKVQALCEHWRNGYDWRRCEAQLNELGQFRTELDGLGIHFLHVRSPHPDAMPLLMTHGWPGSVIEFMKVIGPLTDPVPRWRCRRRVPRDRAVAARLRLLRQADRRPAGTSQRIADAWIELMSRLGYDRWVAQGGDWGAAVTTAIGVARPAGLRGDPRQHAARLSACRRHGRPDAARAGSRSTRSTHYRDFGTRATPSSSGRGRRPWAMGWSIRRSVRPRGSTRRCGPGPTTRARRRMC